MAVEAAKAETRTRSRSLARVAAVPAWLWIGGLVAVSAGIRYALARRLPAPWIMVDELIYSELAKSFAATGHFLLRGQSTAAYGVVYPALISPAWGLFSRVPQAYAAAKVIDSIAISLAAVPAYLLARRVLSRPYAIGAAVLTVAVPSMLYAGMLMTENAFYPAFLLAALATVAWLERPTASRTALVVAAALFAFLTRAEAAAIAPALLTAPLLVSGRRALREFRLLYGLSAAGAILVVAVQAARGASPLGLLGAYEVASHSTYTAGGVSRWLAYHWEGLALSLGVVPFAALLLLALTMRGRPRPERAFLAAAVSLTFWLVLEVAAFASVQTQKLEERNMFYVGPLFFVALLLWIERGAPRPRRLALGSVALAVALPALVPYTKLIGLPAVSDTPSLLPLASLHDDGLPLGDVRWVVLGASAAAGILFLLVPKRYALVLPLLVLAYFAVSQKPNDGKYRQASAGDLYQGIGAHRPDWIDRRVGAGARVAAIWSGSSDKFTIWENEFFNRSLRDFYFTQQELAGDLPEKQLLADRRTGVLRTPDGKAARADYALTDGSVALAGSVLDRDRITGLLLYRVGGPLRQLSRVDGLYPGDTWSGRSVTYTRLDCPGGHLAVTLQSDPGLFTGTQHVTAYVGGRAVAAAGVAPRAIGSLVVPLRAAGATCTVRFVVGRTLVPRDVTHGQNPDPRRLGIHFNAFEYRRP